LASFGERVELIVKNVLWGEADKIFLTVNRPEDHFDSNQFLQPESGKKYIAVLIRYDNESNQTITYDEFNFSVMDSAGGRYNSSYSYIEPSLSFGTLNPTKSVQGYIAFEVPQSIPLSDFSVHYETYTGLSIDFE
jgi:hypothetical protein